jgi:hypothetical protein
MNVGRGRVCARAFFVLDAGTASVRAAKSISDQRSSAASVFLRPVNRTSVRKSATVASNPPLP